MKKSALTICALLALTACGSSPKSVTSNSAGASYTFDGSDSSLKQAGSKAQSNCERSGRLATLQNISKTDDGKVASFDCSSR